MGKPLVLIIDDMPSNLQLLSNLLRNEYTVKVAVSGAKGLQLARADQAPDLILLDVIMAPSNGFDVCKRLKSNSKTQHIPIVFLTNLQDREAVAKGMLLGASDYVIKPVKSHQLLAKVAQHIGHHRQQDKGSERGRP